MPLYDFQVWFSHKVHFFGYFPINVFEKKTRLPSVTKIIATVVSLKRNIPKQYQIMLTNLRKLTWRIKSFSSLSCLEGRIKGSSQYFLVTIETGIFLYDFSTISMYWMIVFQTLHIFSCSYIKSYFYKICPCLPLLRW